MHIELNQEETDFLRELLDQANMSLREEVYKTEGVEWKRALKTGNTCSPLFAPSWRLVEPFGSSSLTRRDAVAIAVAMQRRLGFVWLALAPAAAFVMAGCSGGGGHHAAAVPTATNSPGFGTPTFTAVPPTGISPAVTATPAATQTPTPNIGTGTPGAGTGSPTATSPPDTATTTPTTATPGTPVPTAVPTTPVTQPCDTATMGIPPTATATAPPTPTITNTPLTGPVVTAFGVADSTGTLNPPVGTDDSGRAIFQKSSTTGFIVYVEGRSLGSVVFPVGTNRFTYKPDDPTGQPDLQIETNRALGDGSAAVCDSGFPAVGGVPAVDPPDFRFLQDVSNALNDFACRFKAFTQSDFACTQDASNNFTFANASSAVQFCMLVNDALAFPSGDTVLTARLRDTAGHAGPPMQIVVRISGS